ncbi:MAG: tyrosine-type recombinase/integrase [bacterium]|nr:tyrosine-type recombinase/integrase [bacterium]
MRFTVKKLDSLPSSVTGSKDYGEPGGFKVRVYPGGRKVFYYVYTIEGKTYWFKIGDYGDISLSDARSERDDLSAQVARAKLGKCLHPVAAREAQKVKKRGEPTLADLAGEYMTRWAKVHKKTWMEDERILGKDVLPRWGKRLAKDITRRDVRLLLEDIGERGPVMSNRTLALLSRMFRFGLERDAIPADPTQLIKRIYKEKSKERYLTSDEVKIFWRELEETPRISEQVKDCLRLILLTGQRSGEVVGMRREEIDGDWWNIPGDRTKSGRPHRVYLIDPALQVVNSQKKGVPFVFPSPVQEEDKPLQHLTTRSLSRALIRADNLSLDKFAPHDLRRTLATGLAELGVSNYTIGQILNHSERTVTHIYDRYGHDKEKREALLKWSRHLKTLITGKAPEKVVKLK